MNQVKADLYFVSLALSHAKEEERKMETLFGASQSTRTLCSA